MKNFTSFVLISIVLSGGFSSIVDAADLTVKLTGETGGITLFGAVKRWDQDGNPLRKVDQNEKILEPFADAKANETSSGTWVFKNLPPGTYDLVIVKGAKKIRLEGWRFSPVLDFDPFLPPDAKVRKIDDTGKKVEDHETLEWLENDIKNSKHYENKVVPLYFGAEEPKAGEKRAKFVRMLVMLIRDLETTYEAGAATMRFEIWQYDDKYGGYVKNRKTMVMHRGILQGGELRQWNWLWDPGLGNVKMEAKDRTLEYAVPDPEKDKKLHGLRPY